MTDVKQLVFISCGQATDEERTLGKKVAQLVRELTPFEPYFADFQTSLQGVTQNIFAKLNIASGFITIMHHRGQVSENNRSPFLRASVWIEQEIAIASFLEHTLGKNIHVVAFAEEGVELEGVRKYIILNPKTFKTNSNVLDQLREILPEWQPLPHAPQGLLVEALMTYEVLQRNQDRHSYRLVVSLVNQGTKKVTDFKVTVAVPLEVVINPGDNACYIKSTRTHALFEITHAHHNNMKLYRGETKKVFGVDYFMNDDLFDREDVLNKKITATVASDDMTPRTTERSLRELQQF